MSAKEFVTAFTVYKQQKVLGEGGSGRVILVTDDEGKEYALKALRKIADSQKIKRFKNEIYFQLRADSRYVVPVLDYGVSSDGELFYVMPLYKNTLRKKMDDTLAPDEALGLALQILQSLIYAHG